MIVEKQKYCYYYCFLILNGCLNMKRGKIMPQVVEYVKEDRDGNEIEFKMPKTCPNCGSLVGREEGEVAVKCINVICPA